MKKVQRLIAIALLVSPSVSTPMRWDSCWFRLCLHTNGHDQDKVRDSIKEEKAAIVKCQKSLKVEEALFKANREQWQVWNSRIRQYKKNSQLMNYFLEHQDPKLLHCLRQRRDWEVIIKERIPRVRALRAQIKSHTARIAHHEKRIEKLQEARMQLHRYNPIFIA